MKKLILITISLMFGCGQTVNSDFVPLVERQPYVMNVPPATGSLLENNSAIVLEFSTSLDGETISASSIALV